MKIARPRWPRSTREARALQERLRARVVAEDRLDPVRLVAGVDADHRLRTGLTCAAAAVLELPALSLAAWARACRPTGFAYVPGLLSFRETPAILEALRRLPAAPDLLLVDGQGRAHPRRFGIACHIGVLTDRPTIGVAKSRLVGTFEMPGPRRGQWSPLWQAGEVIGAALTTRDGTRPVFVSVGHRVALETAIALVLRCAPRFRVPEPIRQADRLARRAGRPAPAR